MQGAENEGSEAPTPPKRSSARRHARGASLKGVVVAAADDVADAAGLEHVEAASDDLSGGCERWVGGATPQACPSHGPTWFIDEVRSITLPSPW